jgi:hypothetical protein
MVCKAFATPGKWTLQSILGSHIRRGVPLERRPDEETVQIVIVMKGIPDPTQKHVSVVTVIARGWDG